MSRNEVISWQDVITLMQQMERELNVTIEVKMTLGAGKPPYGCLSIGLRAFDLGVTAKGKQLAAVSSHFPNKRQRTATGALVGALYELLEKVEQVRQERAKQQPLPL